MLRSESAEAFNAFNHPNFTNPSLSLQSPQTFGEFQDDGPTVHAVRAALRILVRKRDRLGPYEQTPFPQGMCHLKHPWAEGPLLNSQYWVKNSRNEVPSVLA